MELTLAFVELFTKPSIVWFFSYSFNFIPIELIINALFSEGFFVCLTKGWIVVPLAKEEGRFDFLILVRDVVPEDYVSAYEYPLLRLDLRAELKLFLNGVLVSTFTAFATPKFKT